MPFKICAFAVLFLLIGCNSERQDFSHTLKTEKKPWTHLDFKNNSNDFQFAVVSDNTGGARPGVFESAIDKINLIQPEFVLSVGDFIQGYTSNMDKVNSEWREFNSWTSRFEMPFFYLPGNHDITNAAMGKVWEEKFGRRYYSFTYKGVLFICLETQDKSAATNGDAIHDAGLTAKQVAWIQSTLKDNDSVRWTFVLMHQPLWLYDAKNAQQNSKHKIFGKNTGFTQVEQALKGRKHTVLAGHFHRYTKFTRNNSSYIVLSTTGGGSKLRGTGYGEFDHAAWITMTDKGPKIANLLLDGIQHEDVFTERTGEFTSSINVQYEADPQDSHVLHGTLTITNPFDHTLHISEKWSYPAKSGWTVSSNFSHAHIKSKATQTFSITLKYDKNSSVATAPKGTLLCSAGSEYNGTIELSSPTHSYAAINRPHIKVPKIKHSINIDGSLKESFWKKATVQSPLQLLNYTGPPPTPSKIYFAQDADNLYIGGVFEQDVASLTVDSKQSSDQLWTDDGIELFFDTNLDKKTYKQALITANNIANLIKIRGITSATARTQKAWTIEVKIPKKELVIETKALKTIGFNIRRNRVIGDAIEQSEWSPSLSPYPHNVDLFGQITF